MRKQTKIWTTKDKKRIRICDMTDKHLTNATKLMQRWAERECEICIHNAEVISAMVSGEIAQCAAEDAMDEAIDCTWEDYVPDIYWNMVDELERRKRN